jgi:hypothetical protein
MIHAAGAERNNARQSKTSQRAALPTHDLRFQGLSDLPVGPSYSDLPTEASNRFLSQPTLALGDLLALIVGSKTRD